jgi:RNA polymerase sigma factor (sigma-70 family)
VTEWEVFTQWWVEVEPSLLRVSRRYGKSSEDAQDIVQDLAILAVKNWKRFTGIEEFRRWAYARLHWLALDQLRGQKHKFHAPLESTNEQSVAAAQEQELIVHEILNLISKLPERQQVVLKRMFEGSSTLEIAEVLNIKESTVRSLQRFARINLVNLLTKKG